MTDILMAPASDWSTHSHSHSHYEDDRSSTVSMDEVDSIPTSPSSTHSYIRSRDTSPMIRSPRDPHPHDKHYPPITSRNLFPHEKSYTYSQHEPHYPHAYITPKQPHYTGTILSDEDDREAQCMHDRMINNLSKLLAVAKSGVDGISEDESTIILQDLGVNVSDLPPPSAQKRLSLPPAATATPQPHVITPTSDVMAMVSTPSSHAPSTPPQHPLSPLPSSTYSPAKSEQSTSSYHHLQSNLEQLQVQLQQHQYQCEQLKHEKDVLNQTLQQFQTSITHTQDELSRQLLIVTSELTTKDAALVALKEEREVEKISHMEQMENAKYKLEMMTKQEEQVREERDRIFNELSTLHQTHTTMSSHHHATRDKLKSQLASLQQQCDELIHEKQMLRDVMKEATDGMSKELEKAVAELKIKESLLDTLTTQVSSHTTTTQEMEHMRQQWQHVQQQCHVLQQEKEKLTHELSDYHAREQNMLHERSQLTTQLQDISTQLITLRQQHTDEVTHSTSLTSQLHAWKQQAENVKMLQNEHHELVTTLQAENEMLRKQKIDIQQAHAATEASLLARLSSLLERLATNDRDYTTLIQQQTAQIESLTQRGEQLQHELHQHEETMRMMQTTHQHEIASLHHRIGGIEDELETRTHELHIANNTIHTLTMKLEYMMRRSYSKGQVLEIVFCLQLVLLVSYLALDWSNGLVMGTQPTFS